MSDPLTKEEIRQAQTTPLTDEELASAYRLVERFEGPYRTVREQRDTGYPTVRRWFERGDGHVLGTVTEGNFGKVHMLLLYANVLPKVLDHLRIVSAQYATAYVKALDECEEIRDRLQAITAQRSEAVAECERLRAALVNANNTIENLCLG